MGRLIGGIFGCYLHTTVLRPVGPLREAGSDRPARCIVKDGPGSKQREKYKDR
jgi:hypothetical protein